MSDTTINLCGNILLKSVKMHFYLQYRNFGGLKSPPIFKRDQNSFLFKNWYSSDCKEPF